MELKVYLKETMTLRPCDGSKTQEIHLSGLDRISPAVLYTLFFYKASCTDQTNHVKRAKRALEKILTPWYPAAGRFRINQVSGKLEIECNSKGVPMISAVTDSKLEDLGRLHEYKACYEKLVPVIPAASDISENPLVVIQITRFTCGGICVGFGCSHALFDGAGAFNFLASWAHISSGKDESKLVLPNHSRMDLLHGTSTHNSSQSSMSIYNQAHIASIQDLYKIPMKAKASDDRCWEVELSRFGHLGSQGGIQLITLFMKKEVIERLKVVAIERGGLSRCSTFDVLCAHVWKARVKTLQLNPITNVCLQFPVDIRSILRPLLSNNFTGNAFVLASVSCAADTLMREPPHSTVKRIQAAKDSITDGYVRSYINALESSEKFFPSMRELTIVTDWMKFPFQELDFGWGKVASAALLATPVPETAFLMPDIQGSGGVMVRLGIEAQHVHHFINNFNDSS